MSNIIDKIQLSGITYDIGGGSITIDPTLDSGSTNPVANSAITTALDAKVNVADNAVSTQKIMYAYDKGDTAWKYPYNQGLRINQFFVKYTESWENSNVPAWNNPMYITNDGSTTSQIYLRVNALNYQITSVASTSGDFTYALEGGMVNVTLPDGYYISSFAQKYSFQILYPKYVINGGQSAQALQNTENVLNDIYSEMPKRWITGGSISCNFNYLNSYLYDNNGNDNSSMMPLGTSIKGEGNKLDVYFDGQTIHQKILNTGSGNYCNVPNNPASNYTDDLNEIIIHFNSGYTGSNTSYTILVQTIDTNTWTYSDNLYYDVANHTLDASSANYVTATTVGDDYTYSIKPKQEYSSYKILTIRENNWCNIAGIDNQRKEEYIITGVTTPSYSYQAQEIIDDLYSKVGGGITSGEVQTMIDESVSGKVDTTTYNTYTAATDSALASKADTATTYTKTEVDTALASKQTTLTAGTNITIVDNVISATGGGGGNPTVELTQAEYDALVTAGTVSADTYYIITDAQAGDLTNYYTKTETNTLLGGKADTATTYTKTEVDNAITAATSTKQDTLVSGTNIKTINNQSLLGSGNIDIQGGGGKAIEAGRGISITTGETADTISFNLPISAGTGEGSVIEGYMTTASAFYSHAEGANTKANGNFSHTEGQGTTASGEHSHAEGYHTNAISSYSHAEGHYTTASSVSDVNGITVFNGYQARHAEGANTLANNASTHTEGYRTVANNFGEHASGVFNNSTSATTTWGDSGNTLFSVGNGTADNARHNAFEIRQNGDIYYFDGTNDVKLQDKFSSIDTTIGNINTILQSI